AYFERWARALGVVDSSGRWGYGTGHVVLLGDMTDRGRWVYPLLWRLYALEAEAQAAGGALHLVLGNHEQYNLVGITKDIEPEHHYAMSRIAPYAVSLDSGTVLGQWLRTRPVALRIGRTLFVHGGISPSVVKRGPSLDALNAASRAFLAGAVVDDTSRDAQLGLHSVTQYRGFVMANGDEPLASEAHVAATLRHFDVHRVVIGHTEVDSITFLHDGHVIDVNATLHSEQALVFDHGVPRVRPLGFRRSAWTEPAPVVRRFALLNRHDWQALLGVFATIRGRPG
ncbi:MAG: metallophosphoesterase, partial [Gemmatimonadaceae bacterium]|nr:metallophosphoesterase [Gemmatimonadaceae bacterium]